MKNPTTDRLNYIDQTLEHIIDILYAQANMNRIQEDLNAIQADSNATFITKGRIYKLDKIPAFSTNQKVPPTIKKTPQNYDLKPIKNPKSFAYRIYTLRKSNGFTVFKLAVLSGVSETTIECIESSARKYIRGATLKKLANVFHVTPKSLLNFNINTKDNFDNLSKVLSLRGSQC